MPQPMTIASNRRFLMYSLRNDAHSITRMSTWTPSSLSDAWTISATFLRSSLPWLVRSSKAKGWSCLFTSTPSAFFFQPASEQRSRLVHVVGVRLHVRVVRPGAGLVGARRRTSEAEQHAVDDLALVDGVGERLPDPPVGEPLISKVEADVRVRVRRVLVLVVGLPEGRVFRLALELQRGEAGRVHALRLQLEEDRRLARDDPIDDARNVRGPIEVIG